MAISRSSNLERGRWRSKCREELSKHIENRLGILIEPSQVRLITNGDDPYTWAALLGKEHLFSKHMSGHSIGAYKELCEGIGVTFEALPATTGEQNSADCLQGKAFTINTRDTEVQVSFSAKIAELQEETKRLARELSQWRDQATAESELRQRAEAEINQVTTANQRLQQEVQKHVMMAEYYKNRTIKYSEGVKRMLPVLEELNCDVPHVQGDFNEVEIVLSN